ncbi:MAG TPA: DUF3540 domain-containing protein [Sandaracinaceae bacterium LLY-WYZ-13_1]|nr:DUF3540 domain-containing protein [Sandaracinaceae bacterium LLY-WYZ-13_1]
MATDNNVDLLRPFAATPPGEPTPRVFGATVRAVTDRVIAVERGDETAVARRAASCLLAPRHGDRVLCAEVEGVAYVLAVLERDAEGTEVEVEGDLAIRSTAGSVEVDAAGDLELGAGRGARLRAQAMEIAAEDGRWVGRELRLLGEQLTLGATRIRQVSSFAERVADSLKETFGRSYRDVEDGEHVRAGSVTYSLRHMLRYHAETAVMSAKKLIKLDGEQIHLG